MKLGAWLLADLGLERNPYAERGLVALAVIACVLGMISTLRWWLQKPPAIVSNDEERGWPFMKRTLLGLAQAASGVLVVLVLTWIATPTPKPPEGWSLIRPPHEVHTLALQNELIWAGGKEGLFAVNRTTGSLVHTTLQSRDLRDVRALLVENDTLWIACTAGLHRWDGKELQKLTPPGLTDTGPITSLKRTRDGALWAGAYLGAWRITADHWDWVGENKGLRLPVVDTIFEDKSGALWFASKEPEAPGLWRYAGGRWELFERTQGIVHPAINDMIEDHRGTLWIACGFGGAGTAQFFDGQKWTDEAVQGLEEKKIRSLFEDRSRRLWFCSEYDGAAIRDGTSWRRLTMSEGLPGNEIKVMAEDADKVLWLGNERGLGRIIGYK